MKAVVLAGGRGTRFGSLTRSLPKPLIAVAGKALIRHVLDAMPDEIEEYIIVLGYLGIQIQHALGFRYRDRPVHYVYQHEAGTGGGLMAARPVLKGTNRFLVTGADDIFVRSELEQLIFPPSFANAARETMNDLGATYGVHLGHSGKGSTMTALFGFDRMLKGFGEVADAAVPRYMGVGAYALPQAIFDQPFYQSDTGEYSIPHTLVRVSFPVECVIFNQWMPVNDPVERDYAEQRLSASLTLRS